MQVLAIVGSSTNFYIVKYRCKNKDVRKIWDGLWMLIFLSEKQQSQQKNTNVKTENTAANKSHKNSKLGQTLMQKLFPAGGVQNCELKHWKILLRESKNR